MSYWENTCLMRSIQAWVPLAMSSMLMNGHVIVWMFVLAPSKFICWNSVSLVMVSVGGAFGSCWNPEDGVFLNKISAILNAKKNPAELSSAFHQVKIQQGVCSEKGAFFCMVQPCWYLTELPASRTVRNKFLLLISYPICSVLLQQLKWTRIQ